jgi:hypothetical protein
LFSTDPWAVLTRKQRLVQVQQRVEAINVGLRDARVRGSEQIKWAARHNVEDHVNQDGDKEQQDEGLNDPPDDKVRHTHRSFQPGSVILSQSPDPESSKGERAAKSPIWAIGRDASLHSA